MKIIITIFALAALTMASDTDIQKALKNSNDQFTAQMFNEVVKENPDKSVVLSAFSVLSPLAQLALASVGESHDELLRALHLPDDNVTKEVFTDVNLQLRTIKGVDLRMANKVYIADGFELNAQFAALSKTVFNSEVQNLNFVKSEEAAKTINTWVEEHTNQRIKNLVDPMSLDGTTLSVLVNAIYFKGSWKNKFVKELTQNRPFHVNKDKTIEVPTMYRRGDYAYGESSELDAKLIEIPYEGEESSFVIVLPNKVDGLSALVDKLKDPNVFDKLRQEMFTTEVDLYLPKYKIETTTDLRKVLENMNVKRLFASGQARLDNLLKDAKDLFVSNAIQKAFIEVNEEGAEAAAANAFYLVVDSMDIHIPLQFIADKPFYYVLRHKAISLFNGVLYEPAI